MNKLKLSLIIIAQIILCSCASWKVSKQASNAQLAAQAAETDADGYMLGPDDTVRVTTEQHPEWSGEYTLRPDGKIFIQGIGEIKLEGLLKDGAEVIITSVLEEYIHDPKVTVAVARYASQVIYVFGEVERPGRYPTDGKNITLRDAIILAGLPGRFAADKRVYIISPRPKKPVTKVINLYRILYRGELTNNVKLHPGDIVYVPKNIWGIVSELVSYILSPLTTTVPAVRAAAVPVP